MNRPPPLRRIFAVYFRGLLIAAIALLILLTLAVRFDWPLLPYFHAKADEQIAPRVSAKSPGR